MFHARIVYRMNHEITPMQQPSVAVVRAVQAMNAQIAEQRYQATVARLRKENAIFWAKWEREQDDAAPMPFPESPHATSTHLESYGHSPDLG